MKCNSETDPQIRSANGRLSISARLSRPSMDRDIPTMKEAYRHKWCRQYIRKKKLTTSAAEPRRRSLTCPAKINETIKEPKAQREDRYARTIAGVWVATAGTARKLISTASITVDWDSHYLYGNIKRKRDLQILYIRSIQWWAYQKNSSIAVERWFHRPISCELPCFEHLGIQTE
jgi:hypothetical protein